ncbi:hypothetical protein TCAL_12368 [Tigriopus californicus]|uniref:Uncharacterized protein n=1 Tax=Tigriopus californicus TaxID=6832 RepID=A0A553P306_TIGCA|nr:hypothetical protein TCAL_12368 [Tigriopus californicus]|eukprot:TCALIF_12368-PA protein Name:"Similar to EHMT2 Histone-lysine N-methyltransferase EHMT2 (Homo sapiens)" AED:0.06 eAED:0.06 QI:38/0.8/0.83/1/1/0.83/6/133/630
MTDILEECLKFILPAASDSMKFSTTSITLQVIKEEIKKLHKKLDKLLNEPRESAIQDLQMGLTSIEHDNFEESYLKFMSVEANATRGFNLSMSDENRLVCTRLKIFAQVMVLTFDHKSRTFVPFEIVPPKKKREVGAAVQASVDLLHENLSGVEFTFKDHFSSRTKERKLQSHRDNVDKVLAVAYPYISSGLGLSNPNQLVNTRSDAFVVSLLPHRYLPEGIDDASELQVGTSRDPPYNEVKAKVFYGVDKSVLYDKTKEVKYNVHFLNKIYDAEKATEKPVVLKVQDKVLTVVDDLDEINRDQQSILHIAAKQGRLDTVKFLIHEGAKINAMEKGGNTPLMLSATSGNPDVTNYLLDRGALADKENNKGETALMLAAKHGRLQTVKTLTAQRVTLNKRGKNGKTAIQYASENRHFQVVDALIKLGAQAPANHTPVIESSRNKYSDVAPPLPPKARTFHHFPIPTAPPLTPEDFETHRSANAPPLPPRRHRSQLRSSRLQFEEYVFENVNLGNTNQPQEYVPVSNEQSSVRLLPKRDPPPIPEDLDEVLDNHLVLNASRTGQRSQSGDPVRRRKHGQQVRDANNSEEYFSGSEGFLRPNRFPEGRIQRSRLAHLELEKVLKKRDMNNHQP